MQIREYQKTDQRLVKEFVLKILGEFGFAPHAEWDKDLEDPFTAYMQNGGMFYVIEDEEKIVGTIAIKKQENGIAEIKRLYLDSRLRGQHIGEKLLEMAISFCHAHNYKTIVLDTWKRLTAAHSLYVKKGFRETRRENEQIFMEKQI